VDVLIGGASGPTTDDRRAQGRGESAAAPHIPALDGLRGLAVVAVVAFHANGALPGGYLGVDLFFVLSGFLITGILVREHERFGAVDLRAFWIRRARRLLPALLALVPAVAVYARVLAPPEDAANLRADALATLGYVANWRAIYARKSYWEIFAAPSPLEHTWSLAIEEQFYVVWPLVVSLVLVVLRRTRRALFATCIVFATASACVMYFTWNAERTSRAYMGSDARAAAILVGAALAVALAPGVTLGPRAARALDIAGVLAGVGLGLAWATIDGQSAFLYRGGFWLTEIAALVLIACAVIAPHGLVARVLALRPLVGLGLISYGLYLWHWPVDVVLSPERVRLRPLPLNALRIAIALAISIASYRFIERPIRTRGVFFARPIVVVPSSFILALLVLFAGTGRRPSRPALAVPTPAAPTPAPSASAASVRWPDFNSVKSSVLPLRGDLPPGTLRILVLGDSVGQYLGEAMRFQQSAAQAFVAQRAVGACSIHEAAVYYVKGERMTGTSCSATWVEDAAELRPDVTLITLGGAFLGPRTCEPDWRKAYRDRLTFLLRAMGPNAGRVILALVPYPGERWRTPGMLKLVECFNDELARIATDEGRDTLDLMGHVCPTKECILISNGWPVRNDGLHFDGPGAAETASWTLSEIRRIAAAPP
jgi:peptidoglycan/LPS O-acetylase OafA/YrhL